jgi:hypothetical protein
LLWNDPNTAIQGPIGIFGIGGTELTFGVADPTNFPSDDPEASHPVSTSRSLDPSGESVINSMIQQLQANQTVFDPFGQPVVTGPQLYTGDQEMAAISRARAKHQSLHNGAAPDATGGLPQRLDYAGINPLRTNPAQFEVSGVGLTPDQAGIQLAADLAPYVQGLGTNAFGAAGYWTGGITNYYCFTIIQLPAGQSP